MLRLLRIRHLAVIEAAEVEFEAGFNVLTGETGAGKSMLVEAIGLLLGGRATADLIRTGEDVAVVEAILDDPRRGELVVRREVTSQGRSRAYVDGALATAAALREVTGGLVELHGQHEHQALLDPLTHLPLVDEAAGLGALAGEVATRWTALRDLRDRRDRVRMDGREKAARLELVEFQLAEIEKAAARAGEDEALAATRHVLANAERVQRLCEESYAALHESEHAVLPTLGQVWKRVGELASLDPRFEAHLAARDGVKAPLEDLALELRHYADGVDASPERLQEVEERLALLERLKRRHGPTLQEVIDRGAALARERDLLAGAGETAGDLDRRLAEAASAYLEKARELASRRRTAATRFSGRVEALLRELAMAHVRFQVRFRPEEPPEEAWGERGIDDAEFYLSANPGEDPRPLARIASGGELSRVMLALKTMSIDGTSPTLIFDEVDAGIGGHVAEVVGMRLRERGDRGQVICITPLTQIAARATTHFHIDKTVRGARTTTSVQRLDADGRIEEVGRMIGGASVGEPVRASARHMIESAAAPGAGQRRLARAKGKQKAKGEGEPA
jgi:DNA repair protein RecN (Recombination protein N)